MCTTVARSQPNYSPLHLSIMGKGEAKEVAIAPNPLTLAGQLAHYAWRGPAVLVSATLAAAMLIGFPMVMREVWPAYTQLIGAEKWPAAAFG